MAFRSTFHKRKWVDDYFKIARKTFQLQENTGN